MATNKNAQIRYKVLDACFANFFKQFFIEDLIAYCEEVLSEHYGENITVSKRQVFDDMNFMKSEAGFSAPIVSLRSGKRVFYRYESKEFSILSKPLTTSEIKLLNDAVETLRRLKNIPGFDWATEMGTRLYSILEIKEEVSQIISFEENPYLKGLEFLDVLYQYIYNRQSIQVEYQRFQEEESKTFILSPYFLKQHNNRWFLLGQNHEHSFLQTLAIDRIISVKSIDKKYLENKIDFNEYFEDVIGVTIFENQPVQKVEIELQDEVISYITSKPLHGSQRVKGNLLFLELQINFELEGVILSYAEKMKVIRPKSFAERIKTRMKEAARQYE